MAGSRRIARANILISVLWIIAAMSVLVLGLSYEARSDVERTMLYRDRVRAYWLARAAVERVKFDFAVAQTNRINTVRAGQTGTGNEQRMRFQYTFADGWAECLLTNNASKMSVNVKDREMWRNLFSLYGLDDQSLDEIADAIMDWTDADNLESLNGAEDAYYQGLTPPYMPRNGPFFSVEEIQLVRGVTEAMYYGMVVEGQQVPGLKDLLTVGSQNLNRMDINTCPAGMLMAFLGMTAEDADLVVRHREETPFEATQDVQSVATVNKPDNLKYFMPFAGRAQGLTIRATGYVNGSAARYTVEDEVRYVGGNLMFQPISYKDFSLEHVDVSEQEDTQ